MEPRFSKIFRSKIMLPCRMGLLNAPTASLQRGKPTPQRVS